MVLTHLTDYLERNARQVPDKPAIICPDRTLTWGELEEEVLFVSNALGGYLTSCSQQIVSLLFENSWQCVVTYLAILRLGHIALPLDTVFKSQQLRAVIEQLSPALIITNAAGVEQLGAQPVQIIDFAKLEAGQNVHPFRLPAEQQIASMLFTSGTTGNPKAAPYTHANHLWNIEASSELYTWTSEDTLLLSLPLSHWHGLVMGISGALYHGNTVYLERRLEPAKTLSLLASGKVSLFMHVSLAYTKLVQFDPGTTYDLSKVRLCISASSALPPPVWHQYKERFGIEILECYGSSEVGRIASNNLTDRQPGSPGKAMPGTELAIGDDGEILIKTPKGLFPGYYNNPEATRKNLLPGGWWKTGDLGTLDENGHVYLKGRTQERIKKQGYSVFPRDVEWAIQQANPSIREIFVMGTSQDENPSDLISYFIVGDISELELRAYCKQQLPSAWRPDRVFFLKELPRTRSGKPILKDLQKLV